MCCNTAARLRHRGCYVWPVALPLPSTPEQRRLCWPLGDDPSVRVAGALEAKPMALGRGKRGAAKKLEWSTSNTPCPWTERGYGSITCECTQSRRQTTCC